MLVTVPLVAGGADTQTPPLEVNTFPELPVLVRPVPPLRTATTPVTFDAVPVVF